MEGDGKKEGGRMFEKECDVIALSTRRISEREQVCCEGKKLFVTSHFFSNILAPSKCRLDSVCEAPCRSAAAKRNCENQHFYAQRRLQDVDSPVSETEREAQELLRFLFPESKPGCGLFRGQALHLPPILSPCLLCCSSISVS